MAQKWLRLDKKGGKTFVWDSAVLKQHTLNISPDQKVTDKQEQQNEEHYIFDMDKQVITTCFSESIFYKPTNLHTSFIEAITSTMMWDHRLCTGIFVVQKQ